MRQKPLNWDFSLRLRTLCLCRNGKLVMQSHSHIPSPSALGVSFQICIIFFHSCLLYVFFYNFSITLDMVKISNTFTPGSGYPVVLLVCNETRNQNHRMSALWLGWGWKTGQGPGRKYRCADFIRNKYPPPKFREEGGSLLQFRSFTHHPDSWTPGGSSTMSPGNPETLPWNCVDLVENMMGQTYTNCLDSWIHVTKKLTFRFIFVTFLNRENNTLLGERWGVEKRGPG